MSKFHNVTLTAKANVYFDGKVTSRSFTLENGETKTLGILLPGEYNFGTGKAELMEIQSGVCEVRLKGSDTWTRYEGGSSFNVPANSSFDIKALEVTDYICSFID
jgi:uncharacterized protein YaiE (UPF0345 family)